MSGILAFGAYIPRLRLQRAVVAQANAWFNPGLRSLGKGERAMANWDEDAITMAVEAARDCLTDINRAQIDTIALSSTSAPNADRQNSTIVKEALNLSDDIMTFDTSGGMRAGTSSLIQALAAAAGGRVTLCVASERRKFKPGSESELNSGDAAAAILVGEGELIARCLGVHSVSIDFVDHFRASGDDFNYTWESRWVRDEGYSKIIVGALRKALAKAGMEAADIGHLIIPIAVKGVAEDVAKKLGARPDVVCDPLGAVVGETGAAHPSLMLVGVLQKAEPGDRILMASFGQGCDALVFEVTDAINRLPQRQGVEGHLARRKPEANYLKYLSFNNLLDIDKGMRAEADFKQPLTALYRHRKTVLGLVGGRCTKTGAVQFPKTDISVNPNDHTVGTQEDYPLAERAAKIVTYTADNLTYSPDPPAFYGMIEFDEGGRMMAEFTDAESDAVEVGRDVRMMFRVKSVDSLRGFTKYFWKAVPVT